MKIYKVFVYGSLTKRKTQQELFGANLRVFSKAVLNGWIMKKGEEYPYITPSDGKSVKGSVLLMTEEQLTKADLWEEVPQDYSREKLTVRVTDGSFFNVWAYTRREQ
jgi:gamma-glutamylcyclotransferase (GGCT)/AIG2-like uncharacterized protein YtfP